MLIKQNTKFWNRQNLKNRHFFKILNFMERRMKKGLKKTT